MEQLNCLTNWATSTRICGTVLRGSKQRTFCIFVCFLFFTRILLKQPFSSMCKYRLLEVDPSASDCGRNTRPRLTGSNPTLLLIVTYPHTRVQVESWPPRLHQATNSEGPKVMCRPVSTNVNNVFRTICPCKIRVHGSQTHPKTLIRIAQIPYLVHTYLHEQACSIFCR